MAQSYVLNTIPLFRVMICVMQVFLLHEVIDRVRRIYCYLSRTTLQNEDCEDVKNAQLEEKEEPLRLGLVNENDMEHVMGRLGFVLDPRGESNGFGDDFTNIFAEKEPSLGEVKGAFDVFDENKDGYVDEMELQKVLCNLGLKEGLEIQNCKKMISKFDENKNGRIDFKEFVKIMENTFC